MIILLSWYTELPLSIRVYLAIVAFFLCMSFAFVTGIWISQILKRIRSSFRSRYKDEIQHEISLFVVQMSMSAVPDAAFRFKLERLAHLKSKSPYLSQLIMDEIVSMKKNLVGESAVHLQKAYIHLGLLEESIRKVKGRSWKRIAGGLRELEVMEQVGALYYFILNLNHSNYYLQREARLGLAGLAPKPLFFLDNLKEPLSDWEKLILYEKLKRRPGTVIPDFSRWYQHPNDTVVSFSIDMTVRFGQFHNIPKLEALLNSADSTLACLIIDALRRMEAGPSLELVSKMLNLSVSSKMAISCMRFIKAIGDESCCKVIQPFLSHYNPLVQFEAVGTIKALGGGISPIQEENNIIISDTNIYNV